MAATIAAGRRQVDRLVDHGVEPLRVAHRRILRLDDAEIEQVVDDPPEPLRLLHHALRQRLRHGQVGLRRQGVGEQLEAHRSASSARD
ncbi:MAG: hypothetical protein U0W40_09285 [Acidimicrobiia bacterium]